MFFLWNCGQSRKPEPQKALPGSFLFLPYTTGDGKTIKAAAQSALDIWSPSEMPRLYFRSIERAYLYFILFTPGDEMKLLFPGSKGQFPADYSGKEYILPEDNQWSKYFGPPGYYTLYMIAGIQELPKIKEWLSQYDNGGKSRQAAITANMRAEIQRLQRESALMQNLDKKPELMGGTIRSEDSLFNFAWPVQVTGTFIYQIDINYTPENPHE